MPALIVFQPADRVELKDFTTQVIEMVFRIRHGISHCHPFFPQLVEENIKLPVFGVRQPELGLEVLDAEIEDFVLRSRPTIRQ